MSEPPAEAIIEPDEPAPRRRGRWLRWLGGGVLALLLIIAAALLALDTAPGRRFIIDRIEAMAPANGLRIRIGRIDGSIYDRMTISDLRLYDPQGLFFEAPRLEVAWRPLEYLFADRLRIESASSELLILHKPPQLIPSADPDAPMLPGFDITVERLAVDRFRFEPPVMGERRQAAIMGEIDIRDGRARVNLAARAIDGGDRLRLALVAEPDGDVFDLEARVAAPADGIIAGLTGIDRPLALAITGDGTWTAWRGTALLDDAGRRIADLNLEAREGQYTLGGAVRTETLLTGVGARLTAPQVIVNATSTFEERVLDGRFTLRSPSLALAGSGAIDLGASAFRGFEFEARLLRPQALAPDIRGRDVRFSARLDGPFGRAGFAYRLTTPRVAFGNTVVTGLIVEGEGRLSDPPIVLPLSATARSVTGYGAQADELLTNVAIEGAIRIADGQIVGDDLSLRSDRLTGDFSLIYDLRRATYSVALNAELARYYIPGLGLVDLRTNVDIVPAPGGGVRIAGRARAVMRRLDNAFLANLAGGLPTLESSIAYGPGRQLDLTNLRITGPAISLSGRGYRRPDGTFYFTGSGRQDRYGPLQLTLDGPITRPHVELVLASPYPPAGLADVRVTLDPVEAGFAYVAAGDSRAGPFTANGVIRLPGNAPVTIGIAALDVADTHSTGEITLAEGGFAGTIDTTGPGLTARIALAPVNGVQSVEVDVAAENASIGGEIDTTIRQATVDVSAMIHDSGARITGTVDAYGIARRGVFLARLEGDVEMTGGAGRANVSLAGARGREFDFDAAIDFAPGAVTVNGSGNFEGEPIALTPVRITALPEGGWRLDESTITYAGGGATLSGRLGGGATALNGRFDNVPLGVVDIFYPEIGFGGQLTGTIDYRQAAGESVPTANVEVRVRSLTREGFVLTPRPVNLGLNARLAGGSLAARAILEGDGEEVLRAQVRIAPLSGVGTFGRQLASAPLFAEMRYQGPAETIWQLTGNDTLNISGPITARADARGTLNTPEITGLVRTQAGRIESLLTGTVIENVTATGNFERSTLTIPQLTGTTPEGGSVSGNARFDLGLAAGLGMDIRLQAENALLINRDDIAGRVTGPLSITLQTVPDDNNPLTPISSVGRIEGDLDLVEGRFRLGQAAAAAQIPELNVVEINAPLDLPEPRRPATDWQLAIDVAARNRFTVTGLGLDSEWSADLEVRGPLSAFTITGAMNLIRGEYEFAGRGFELERGRIEFYGQTPINPTLDLAAVAELDGVNATINIGGTSAEPEISFTSIPALPQDELLSRMLFGTSITSLSAPEALQLAASVAALRGGGGGGLNPINAVRDAIGLDRLRILPADLATGRGTAVAAGKYITRRLYVEVITDGQGYSATQVEYQITRWLTLLSTVSTVGRQSLSARISRDY